MRLFVVTALAMFLSTAAAIAADDDTDAPIRYHVPGVTVVVQKQGDPIHLREGPKITWLREAFSYKCLATQCLIVATSEVQSATGSATPVCVYADGKPMRPACEGQGDNGTVRNLQAKRLPQGVHSFRAGVGNETNYKKLTACPCIVTYQIYDSGN